MSGPVVPYTPMLRRYHQMKSKGLTSPQRLELAEQLTDDGGEQIARDFADTVRMLKRYDGNAPFRDSRRKDLRPPPRGVIRKGPDVAWLLQQQKLLQVEGEPELILGFVDYEASIMRTQGAATFDQPFFGTEVPPNPSAGNPLWSDVVMVNEGDRMPVLGEVKVATDKEPFTAVIQLLTYIAHLSTKDQYARLRATYPDAGFLPAEVPRFDAYVILHEFGTQWDDGTQGFVANTVTYREPMLQRGRRLAELLLDDDEIARHVRRLDCLQLSLRGKRFVATRGWPAPAVSE